MGNKVAVVFAACAFVGGFLSLLEVTSKLWESGAKPAHKNQKVTAHFPAEDTALDGVM